MYSKKDLENITNVLKLSFATELTDYYHSLCNYEIPTREENQSEEEFDLIYKQFMLDHIDEVLEKKRVIFLEVLDKYNDLLSSRQQLFGEKDKNEQEHNQSIEKCEKDVKRTFAFVVLGALFLPRFLLAVLAISSSRWIVDFERITYHKNELLEEKTALELIEKVKDDLFDFSYTLRVDYHDSVKELEELKRRALHGENIMPDLVTMMAPERISLPRVEVVVDPEGVNVGDLDFQKIADETVNQGPGFTKVLKVKQEIQK